ncbi:MAG: Ldh family oxidoreductase [Gammaproteobacteria bacterium]|nr:Ldh family oxidoreductase [Gammaproteobacteria bacterium]
MSIRFHAKALIEFTTGICIHFGMEEAPALDVAHILVEGDLLGHDTHGLQLLKPYIDALDRQVMRGSGEINEIASRPAVACWDGQYLPGPYLTLRAIESATHMAQQYGTGSIAIRRSSHIGALAAYLEKPSRSGYLIQIVCSDPSVAIVAPFGGSEPLLTPNPMAWGIPTSTDPIMIDISASITTSGMSSRLHSEGRPGDHPWWLDANGQPTNNPSVVFDDPPGSLQALGGMEAGHKGFGLALFVEAMSSALAGHGREEGTAEWGASVHVQVTDISAFGDASAFHNQTDFLVEQCLQNKPANPDKPVRIPGQRGLALKAEQLNSGVALRTDIVSALTELATQANISLPARSGNC